MLLSKRRSKVVAFSRTPLERLSLAGIAGPLRPVSVAIVMRLPQPPPADRATDLLNTSPYLSLIRDRLLPKTRFRRITRSGECRRHLRIPLGGIFVPKDDFIRYPRWNTELFVERDNSSPQVGAP
jgi:hypothetical protein